MTRLSLAIAAIAVVSYVLVQLVVTTDREIVEQKLEHLLERAREGGGDAVTEIMAAFADDYDDDSGISRAMILRYLQNYVGKRKVLEISTGSYKTVWNGDEISVPILRIDVRLPDWQAKMVLTVNCAERDGDWKIVSVSRLRWGSGG